MCARRLYTDYKLLVARIGANDDSYAKALLAAWLLITPDGYVNKKDFERLLLRSGISIDKPSVNRHWKTLHYHGITKRKHESIYSINRETVSRVLLQRRPLSECILLPAFYTPRSEARHQSSFSSTSKACSTCTMSSPLATLNCESLPAEQATTIRRVRSGSSSSTSKACSTMSSPGVERWKPSGRAADGYLEELARMRKPTASNADGIPCALSALNADSADRFPAPNADSTPHPFPTSNADSATRACNIPPAPPFPTTNADGTPCALSALSADSAGRFPASNADTAYPFPASSTDSAGRSIPPAPPCPTSAQTRRSDSCGTSTAASGELASSRGPGGVFDFLVSQQMRVGNCEAGECEGPPRKKRKTAFRAFVRNSDLGSTGTRPTLTHARGEPALPRSSVSALPPVSTPSFQFPVAPLRVLCSPRSSSEPDSRHRSPRLHPNDSDLGECALPPRNKSKREEPGVAHTSSAHRISEPPPLEPSRATTSSSSSSSSRARLPSTGAAALLPRVAPLRVIGSRRRPTCPGSRIHSSPSQPATAHSPTSGHSFGASPSSSGTTHSSDMLDGRAPLSKSRLPRSRISKPVSYHSKASKTFPSSSTSSSQAKGRSTSGAPLQVIGMLRPHSIPPRVSMPRASCSSDPDSRPNSPRYRSCDSDSDPGECSSPPRKKPKRVAPSDAAHSLLATPPSPHSPMSKPPPSYPVSKPPPSNSVSKPPPSSPVPKPPPSNPVPKPPPSIPVSKPPPSNPSHTNSSSSSSTSFRAGRLSVGGAPIQSAVVGLLRPPDSQIQAPVVGLLRPPESTSKEQLDEKQSSQSANASSSSHSGPGPGQLFPSVIKTEPIVSGEVLKSSSRSFGERCGEQKAIETMCERPRAPCVSRSRERENEMAVSDEICESSRSPCVPDTHEHGSKSPPVRGASFCEFASRPVLAGEVSKPPERSSERDPKRRATVPDDGNSVASPECNLRRSARLRCGNDGAARQIGGSHQRTAPLVKVEKEVSSDRRGGRQDDVKGSGSGTGSGSATSSGSSPGSGSGRCSGGSTGSGSETCQLELGEKIVEGEIHSPIAREDVITKNEPVVEGDVAEAGAVGSGRMRKKDVMLRLWKSGERRDLWRCPICNTVLRYNSFNSHTCIKVRKARGEDVEELRAKGRSCSASGVRVRRSSQQVREERLDLWESGKREGLWCCPICNAICSTSNNGEHACIKHRRRRGEDVRELLERGNWSLNQRKEALRKRWESGDRKGLWCCPFCDKLIQHYSRSSHTCIKERKLRGEDVEELLGRGNGKCTRKEAVRKRWESGDRKGLWCCPICNGHIKISSRHGHACIRVRKLRGEDVRELLERGDWCENQRKDALRERWESGDRKGLWCCPVCAEVIGGNYRTRKNHRCTKEARARGEVLREFLKKGYPLCMARKERLRRIWESGERYSLWLCCECEEVVHAHQREAHACLTRYEKGSDEWCSLLDRGKPKNNRHTLPPNAVMGCKKRDGAKDA